MRVVKEHPIRKTFETILMVFIVILFIVSSFFGGYYMGANKDIRTVINKISNATKKKKKTTEVTETKEEKKVDLADSKIANLIPNLLKGFDCWTIEEFANDKKIVANDISAQRAFTIAETNTFYFSRKQIISFDEYNNEIKKFLGSSYLFNPEKIEYGGENCPQFEYQKDSKEFIRRPNNCGGVCGNNVSVYRVINGKYENDNLILIVKVLFGSREGTNFYKDYNKMKFITNDPDNLDNSLGQGGEYQFTFREEQGNYVFVSSEPAN